MQHVTLYTRKGCHLCEQTANVIEQARRESNFALDVIDIDADPGLHDRYDDRVPVVAIDGNEVFFGNIDERALLERLKQ